MDSPAALTIASETLRALGARRPLPVLVEVGMQGWRTGCRSAEEAVRLAEAVDADPHLELAGFEGYEGVAGQGGGRRTLDMVDAFLHRLRRATESALEQGIGATRSELILSAGGSAYFDRVIEVLGPLARRAGDGPAIRLVLRPGCYVAHDAGRYQRVSPLDGRATGGAHLRNALEVWAPVLSRPEPELAILGCGRRDVSYDLELPRPLFLARAGGAPEAVQGAWTVFRLADQHAFLQVNAGAQLDVGDLVGLGISHPCTTFDKWSLLPLIDRSNRVTGAVRTFF